jgi:hypothetical protein
LVEVAAAQDYCFGNGGATMVFKDFSLPAKDHCTSAFEISPNWPGLVGSGVACTTHDGQTLLFTTSDMFVR